MKYGLQSLNNEIIDHRFIMVHDGATFTIGGEVFIGPFVSIIVADKVSIGDRTIIASGVCIVDHDHNFKGKLNSVGKKSPISIGNSCWIGANAVILKGVVLEDNCVVGAGAVVLAGHYSKGSVLVGNPAKKKENE